ncbi:MAG: CBS domain-containing protein [Bryobacteraceae bacterium]|jgi:CBS domain-containing protein
MAETIASILRTKADGIWSISPDATVYEAIAMMAEKTIGALLVMREGTLVGLISERDYARKVILQGRSSKDTLVQDIMTRSVITVTPEQSVDECMRIITQHRIRHLPVVEHDKLVGIVSIGDLVKAIISDQAQTIDHLHTYITHKYPA